MEKPRKELLGAIALVLAIVAAGHLWAAAADACALKPDDLASELGKANGCFEYWGNRYQTAWTSFLATTAVLIAARFAWVGVKAQVDGQRKANALSEFAFWTQVYRQDSQALSTCEIALDLCGKVNSKLSNRNLDDDRPNRGVMEALRNDGLVPFELVPTVGAEELAFKLNRLLKKANEYWRRGQSLGKLSDVHLGEALDGVSKLVNRLAQHRDEVLVSLLEANRRLQALERLRN